MAATATARSTNLCTITTSYQDVLGTVGAYLDEHRFSEIRLVETGKGFVLGGIRYVNSNGRGTEMETVFLSTDQLRQLTLWY